MSSNVDYITEVAQEQDASDKLSFLLAPPLDQPSKVITIELVLKDYILPEELDDQGQSKSAVQQGLSGLWSIDEVPSTWEIRNQQTYFIKINLAKYEPQKVSDFKKFNGMSPDDSV